MGNNYIITIGREYGSGGFEIGKKLAEKLGFREILRKKNFRTVNGKKYDAITFLLNLQ